jgi:hypothetical protein
MTQKTNFRIANGKPSSLAALTLMLPVVATPLLEMLPLKLLTLNDVTDVATFPTYISFAG